MPSTTASVSTKVINLNGFSWPQPPPSPPTSPPLVSPPPLLSLNSSRSEGERTCTFYEGIDFSLPGANDHLGGTHMADSSMQCCALCGLHIGCTGFVFMPESNMCVLMPVRIAHEKLVKVMNPSTVAGTIYLSHAAKLASAPVKHAACDFKVGSGYSGGLLDPSAPLESSERIETQQDRHRP